MPDERLIVFTRYPEPGRVKTRLIPVLGAEAAADLHREMAERTVQTARELAAKRAVAIEIRYEGGDAERMREWLGDAVTLVPQSEGDLGRRLTHAFQSAFESGASAVAAIGADCPSLMVPILEDAFDSLAAGGAVIGPATDGGYYLIGLTHPVPELFAGIAWGTDQVLLQTCEIAGSLGMAVTLLPLLADVDRPEDLPSLQPSE